MLHSGVKLHGLRSRALDVTFLQECIMQDLVVAGNYLNNARTVFDAKPNQKISRNERGKQIHHDGSFLKGAK